MEAPESAVTASEQSRSFIEVARLTKRFAEVTAVEQISFDVCKGELFGLLGPNGAGKTTAINLLTGLARPDSGTIRIGGLDCARDPKAAQQLIGVVPDESNLYPELTGFENLCFCAALYGIRKSERQARAHRLLESFGLTEAAHRKFQGYSKGMKRKITIAAGIIHCPAVLFLDEPTVGLDVVSARHIRQMIAELHRAGTTIFLTTHYIEEAERLCGRVGFMVNGRIIRIDTVANLLQPVSGSYMMLISVDHSVPNLSALVTQAFPALAFTAVSDLELRIESTQPISVAPIVRFIDDHGVAVTEARRAHPSLEDVFVRITGVEADALKSEKEKTDTGL
jgi:ABC-2 type transport system ATP-binding protein